MNPLQKLVTGVVTIGLVTTLILPKRQTPKVIAESGKALSGLFGTVMGTR